MKKHDLPQEIQNRIDKELLAGERLLWAGLPGKRFGIDMRAKATMLGLVSMLGLGMFAFLFVSNDGGELWVTGAVMPVFLIVIGLAVFAVRALQIRNQADLYAVTNRRAIILRKKTVQSFGKEDLKFIERKMNRDGTGDIIFGREYYQRMTMAGTTPVQTRESESIGFFGIDNPSEVEALMLETFRSVSDDSRDQHNRLGDDFSDFYGDEQQQAQYS